MINSSKAFRKIVVRFEREIKDGSLNGVAIVLADVDASFPESEHWRAINLCTLIERIVQNRSGHLTFEDRAALKTNFAMRTKIKAQQKRNQIRKQDEAPEMGADSSLIKVPCDSQGTTPSDYGHCEKCGEYVGYCGLSFDGKCDDCAGFIG